MAESAVVWPIAQLLRTKGLHLLPAVSVARDGWAALIVAPFGIEPELGVLVDAGYAVVGQRWTAVREEDDRVALLHLPGWVERAVAPRLRYLGVDAVQDGDGGDARVDLTAGNPLAQQNHAFCSVVLIAEPGRRPAAHLRDLPTAAAANMLRRSWPLVDLQPDRKAVQLCRQLPPAVPVRRAAVEPGSRPTCSGCSTAFAPGRGSRPRPGCRSVCRRRGRLLGHRRLGHRRLGHRRLGRRHARSPWQGDGQVRPVRLHPQPAQVRHPPQVVDDRVIRRGRRRTARGGGCGRFAAASPTRRGGSRSTTAPAAR